ncbi:MAG: CoA-binding protein [Bacteroidota bacterium]
MPDISSTLRNAKTIAVVGASPRPGRTSHSIAQYLIAQGYTVIPVNPHRETIFGVPCYPDLQSIPADQRIDIVNIFRRSDKTAGVIRDLMERIDETGEQPVVWTQLGVSSREATQLIEDADLPYVHERCIYVEHIGLRA